VIHDAISFSVDMDVDTSNVVAGNSDINVDTSIFYGRKFKEGGPATMRVRESA
jgi:hypothetical protein